MAIANSIGSGSVKGGSRTRNGSVKGGSTTESSKEVYVPAPSKVKPPVWHAVGREEFLASLEAFSRRRRGSQETRQVRSELANWISELRKRNIGFSGAIGRVVVATTNAGKKEEVVIAIKTPDGVSIGCIAQYVSKAFSNGVAAKVVDFRNSPVSFDGLLWTSDRFPEGVLVKGDGGKFWRVEAIL